MNHCPVYCAVGGHAYDSVYAGPIGAVLTPALDPTPATRELAEASTFCGRCESVCPVEIPLVALMRRWREQSFAAATPAQRALMRLWAQLALHPSAYHRATRIVAALLGRLGRRRGSLAHLPWAGGWTRHRDFPAPQGPTFQHLWARRSKQP
jgi:L-lactate dehydrogenase complex protein LldF